MSRFPSRCPGVLDGLGLGLGLGLALASAGLVSAAPLAAQGPQAKAPGSASGLFVSPFGEPFRSSHGLADWFAGADGDHDGVLTLKEFTADGLRFLTVLDTDKDGRVDGFENTTYENEVAPEILPQSAAFRPGREDDDGAGAPAPRARGLEGASDGLGFVQQAEGRGALQTAGPGRRGTRPVVVLSARPKGRGLG